MCTMAPRSFSVPNLFCEMNMSYRAIHLFRMQRRGDFRWAAFDANSRGLWTPVVFQVTVKHLIDNGVTQVHFHIYFFFIL